MRVKIHPKLRTCHSIWIQSASLGAYRPALPPQRPGSPVSLALQFGDSQQLRLVRILRSTVMVRVGGGWMALDEFLVKNDPCRGKKPRSAHVTCQPCPHHWSSWSHGVLTVGSVRCLSLSCPDVTPVSADGNLVGVPGQTRGEGRRGGCCWGRWVSRNTVNKN